MRSATRPLVRRIAVGALVVLAVALSTGALAQLWYRTVEQGEQQADQRSAQQVAALLLRRIEREGGEHLTEILADFDAAVDSHVVVVAGEEVLATAGTPAVVRAEVRRIREPQVLVVSRRLIDGTPDYEVFGGQSSYGPSGYLVREATAPERATTLRPAFIAGWVATVVLAAGAAFMVGRARAAGVRRARDRERSLTSAIAHEIRTPLGAMVTAAGLLEAHVDAMPPSARRPAELLVEETERLRSLVEELLALARLEAGDHEMHVEVVPLAAIVTDVLAARSWQDEVATDLDRDVTVAVDRLSVSRVLLNLVDNALRHGGGRVAVRVARDRGDAVVTVSDGADTIDPAELERLLEGDLSEQRAGRRRGLGLRIAQQNAALHGTRITASRHPTRGTTLELRLPTVAGIDGGATAPW